MIILFLGCWANASVRVQPAYWIWAGIVPADAPAQAELLIYQGNFIDAGSESRFEHKGIYPSPLDQGAVWLVFRMHELPDQDFLHTVVNQYISRWNQHQVEVKGIQLDFDSPSAKLNTYARYLKDLRTKLPPNVKYSITGLGTWLMDADKQTIADLHQSVDHVTYQLYVGRKPLKYVEPYLNFLQRLQHPFKIGLLYQYPDRQGIEQLQHNPSFRGITYFIQK
ncbi:DUF3142 domain-containing protein [Marinicella sp. W31]|uniref:DUF3142 domain-containing protein n=1 Tax=Marinicella sp. W31 TaxID=3023713 RepID=UPI003756C443